MASATGRGAAVVRAALLGESLWLFLLAWFVLGCFVNTRDQVTWNLQHAWVESLGERGTMYVDGSATPRFALDRLGDYWTASDGHAYPRNAPGTYLTGALAYVVLNRAFELSYRNDFELTSTLVTFLTTGLASALTFLLLYRLAKHATGRRLGGLGVASAHGFGTIAFPYSGVLYQHQTAAVFFVACFALALAKTPEPRDRWPPVVEGLLLGIGMSYSFAYAPVALGLAAYCLTPLGRARSVRFTAGLALGIAPLLAMNALYYGGPLTTVYQASGDPQVTGLELSLAALSRRLRFYLSDPTTGVFFYSPVLLLSLPGLLALPSRLNREKLAVAGTTLLGFGHLLIAGGVGALQFGPRLVIPMLPFLALGYIPIWAKAQRVSLARWARLAFLLLLVASIAFCALGAMGSTMFRDVGRWNAWWVYLHNLRPPVPEGMPRYNLLHYVFPLRGVLQWLALAAGLIAAWRLLALRREPIPGDEWR